MAAEKVELKEVGDYELITKVGQGGMGSVFKARQKSLDRIVALKILPPSFTKDQKFIERFLREARTSAKLNHENIVQGIDVGKDEALGLYYFAMEFVDGPSLKGALAKEKVFSEKRALEIARQIASALECAERAGIVHRDIKPDNILLMSDGSVKLADLGLARQSGTSDAGITVGGTAMGTPYYMSPEQVRGELDKVTVRSDIYSLGATLFHLVTGRQPFTGATSALIMSKHLTESPPKARELNPEISEGCSKLIFKMLQKDQAKRPQNARELLSEVNKLLGAGSEAASPPAPKSKSGKHEPVSGRAPTGRHRPVTDSTAVPVRRRKSEGSPALLIGGGVLVLGVVGFLLVSGNNGRPAPAPIKTVAAPTGENSGAAARTTVAPVDTRAAQAADALDKALKAEGDVFDKARKLAAVEATVRATPSEAAWKKAAEDAAHAVEKLLGEQSDYAALIALKEKCAQPPLASLFEKACKDAEGKALAVWTTAQQGADTKVQLSDFAGAREAVTPFSKSPVPPVAAAARGELERIANLEKEKNERDQKLAEASKVEDERLRYELYMALFKFTEKHDLANARKTLDAWRSKPENKGIVEEITSSAAEFKWLEDQGTVACKAMAAQNATVEIVFGKSVEKKKVKNGGPEGISVSIEGGEGTSVIPMGNIAIAEIVKYCGGNQPGKDGALNAAKYLFWRNQLKDARKRIEAPASDDEKKMLERIDLALNGAEKFYKPQPPKNVVAAVPKDMAVGGKAPEGVAEVPVVITWETGSPNSRKFRVERKAGAGDFQNVTEIEDKKFCDVKQPLDTQLTYRVVALNTAGESPASEASQVKTPLPKVVNLLPNGDFESGHARDWGPQDNAKGAVAITSDGAHSGRCALVFHRDTGTDRTVDVKDGTKYEVTGWVKIVPHGDNQGGGDVYCFVRTMDYNELGRTPTFTINGGGGGGGEREKIPANEWKKFRYTFTAKGNQIRFRMHKFHDDGCDAMFDDFVLTEAP